MVVMVFPDPPVAPVTKVWVMPNLMELPVQAVAKLQQYVDRGSAELHYARKMFEAGRRISSAWSPISGDGARSA